MSEWRDVTLGEVIDITHGYAFKGEFFRLDGDLRLVTPGNFLEGGGFVDRKAAQKSYEGPIQSRYVLQPGDVVLAMTEQSPGLLGSTGLVPQGGTWLHNQRIGRICARLPDVDVRFIYYLFNAPTVRAQVYATATGTKVRHTSPERLLAVRVRLPSLETQTRIASMLATFDTLVSINDRRIELFEDLAASLYREWFVKPLTSGQNRQATGRASSTRPPEGWRLAQLGEVAAVNQSTARVGELPDHLEYLDIAALRPRRVGKPTSMDVSKAPGRARRLATDGDTLWATVRPNRRAHALVHDPPSNLIVSTGLAVLTPKLVPSGFLFELTSAPEFTEYLVSRATGAAYPAVRPVDFEEAPIVVPPASLLEKFAVAVDPMHRAVSALAAESRVLAATRDLLLPRLISGRLDISDIDLGDLLSAEASA